jgi:hypothetical protein
VAILQQEEAVHIASTTFGNSDQWMITIRMTKLVSWTCGICTAVLIFYTSTSCTTGNSKNSSVQLSVFPAGKGWGYQITRNNKVYIYQPYIPVIQGQRPFPTYVSAKNTAQKIINKLLSNQIPAVTVQDLISEGIRCN